jgi:hypothetical protein
MVWGAIGYHMRSRLLRIEGNLNRNRYIRELKELHQTVLTPEERACEEHFVKMFKNK